MPAAVVSNALPQFVRYRTVWGYRNDCALFMEEPGT
jgi:hypothetical protein